MGLGAQPNVVPEGEPVHDGDSRPVEVGWHPVGGLAGKWFANSTGLGKLITEKIHQYPDPTQHWAVLVGDYVHQLWMVSACYERSHLSLDVLTHGVVQDENFHVIYINEKVKREEWKTFSVGQTRFNDDALRRTGKLPHSLSSYAQKTPLTSAGESVIATIREKTPVYNLITNNCQTYALQLLDAIKVGARKEFGTTLAVYNRIFSEGKVADLFNKDHQQPADGEDSGVVPAKEDGDENTVGLAQQLMNDNTAQLDTHEQANKKSGELTPPREDETQQQEQEQSREAPNGTDGGNGGSDKRDKKVAEVKKQIKNIFSRFSRNKSSS